MTQYSLPGRPYSDEDAAGLIGSVVSEETAEWHYRKHHAGYVAALNAIEEATATTPEAPQNGNYAPYAEAKRRYAFNHAGTVLHEIYWENMGGEGDTSKMSPDLKASLERDFGSVEELKKAFMAAAMSTKLSGWAVLAYDSMLSQKWQVLVVDDHHNGALWGSMPLIAIDMFEHAYYHKDGPNRPQYISHFWENLHWGRISERYAQRVRPLES